MMLTWQPGTTLDLHPHMLELALRIVGKCLFDLDQFDESRHIASAVDSFMGFLPLAFLPFSQPSSACPSPPCAASSAASSTSTPSSTA